MDAPPQLWEEHLASGSGASVMQKMELPEEEEGEEGEEGEERK